MNNSGVKKRGRPSKASIAAKSQPNPPESAPTSTTQPSTTPSSTTQESQSSTVRPTPTVKPVAPTISAPATTTTSSISVPSRTPATSTMAPSAMMKPSSGTQSSISLQQQQQQQQLLAQQLIKRKAGGNAAPSTSMPPPTTASGATGPNATVTTGSAANAAATNTVQQTIANSLLNNSVMNTVPNTQTFSVLLQQQLQQHASMGAISPINFMDEISKMMQSFGETKFCIFDTVKLVEQFTKKKCIQLIDKMIANRYDLFHCQKKRNWDSFKEESNSVPSDFSEQSIAPLTKKQKTSDDDESESGSQPPRPLLIGSNPLDIEEEEEEEDQEILSISIPQQQILKDEETTPNSSASTVNPTFSTNSTNSVISNEIEKRKQKKIFEELYCNKSIDVSDVLYLFNKNSWKWKRLERISRLVPFHLEYIAEDGTQNFSEGILKSIQLANASPKEFHFLPTLYLSEQEELKNEDQEFIQYEKERLQKLVQYVSSMSEEEYKEYQSLRMENFQSRKFREWLGIKDVTFTDAGLSLLQYLAWDYVGLLTLTSLIVKREMNANQYKNIMISRNIRQIVTKVLLDNERKEETIGIITGVMSPKMRTRMKLNPANYLVSLPPNFKLTKVEEDEFQEQAIQVAHVYEAIRRITKLQKQDFHLSFV